MSAVLGLHSMLARRSSGGGRQCEAEAGTAAAHCSCARCSRDPPQHAWPRAAGMARRTDALRLGCRIPETQPWFHRCLCKVMLAQAQGLFAYNALLKGSPGQLTVALYIGTSDLFEEAVKMINSAEDADEPMPCGDFKCAHPPSFVPGACRLV